MSHSHKPGRRSRYFIILETGIASDGHVCVYQIDQITQVTVRKKTVDATRMETRVPSTTKPNFTVEDGVNIVPVNGLSRLSKPWAR